MNVFSYETFTRKQANYLYAAIKRGELAMPKSGINALYNLVNKTTFSVTESAFRACCEDAISFLTEGNTSFAQTRLDDVTFGYKTIIYNVICLTEDDIEDSYWFNEPGNFIALTFQVLVPKN